MEIINRKAKFEYEILDKFEAGIVLTGTEIKSIRNGNANIKDRTFKGIFCKRKSKSRNRDCKR